MSYWTPLFNAQQLFYSASLEWSHWALWSKYFDKFFWTALCFILDMRLAARSFGNKSARSGKGVNTWSLISFFLWFFRFLTKLSSVDTLPFLSGTLGCLFSCFFRRALPDWGLGFVVIKDFLRPYTILYSLSSLMNAMKQLYPLLWDVHKLMMPKWIDIWRALARSIFDRHRCAYSWKFSL